MTLDNEKLENRIWTETLELNLISTAYYLCDKMGFSSNKTIMCLDNVTQLCESIRHKNVSLDELRNTLIEEHGLKIRKTFKGVVIESVK